MFQAQTYFTSDRIGASPWAKNEVLSRGPFSGVYKQGARGGLGPLFSPGAALLIGGCTGVPALATPGKGIGLPLARVALKPGKPGVPQRGPGADTKGGGRAPMVGHPGPH